MNKYLLIFCSGIVLLASCKVLPSTIEDNRVYLQKQGREKTKWKLVWKDDFNGTAIDTSKWSKADQGKSDWNKHMSNNAGCYAFADGKLFLRGIKNPDTTKDARPYLTGGIWSKAKFAFQYGRIEIRAKLECAQGAWPAMWMLAAKDKYGPYPRNGEIDIMEHLNFDSIIYQTTHSYYTLELKQDKNPPHYSTAKMIVNDFNVFGLEWYPDKLVFTLNGVQTFTYPRKLNVDSSQWPYDQPFYILIDQQLGGNWVGKINPAHLPVQMIVDWVKVYQ
jgi:beta-glucanase (GH16 family)